MIWAAIFKELTKTAKNAELTPELETQTRNTDVIEQI